MEIPEYRTSYSKIFEQAEREKWQEMPHLCEKCENGALSYSNENERGDRRDGYTFIECSWCHDRGWVPDEEV